MRIPGQRHKAPLSSYLYFALIFSLLLSFQGVVAQALLELGQLSSGTLTADAPKITYFIGVEARQSLEVQVVSATAGLFPQVTIYSVTGDVVETIDNLTNSPSLASTIALDAGGIYRLEVSGVNDAPGQFVILVQAYTAPIPEQTLTVDEAITDSLAPAESISYAVTADANVMQIVSASTDDSAQSVHVQLIDPSGAVITTLETPPTGGVLLITEGEDTYTLVLSNEEETALTFTLTLTTVGGVPASTATPTAMLTPTATTHCLITTLGGGAVNVRQGPSTQFASFTSLFPEDLLPVVGRNGDGTWFQIDTGGVYGWVALSVTQTSGDCTNLQVVIVPTPTFSPPTETAPAPPTTAPATGFEDSRRLCALYYGANTFVMTSQGEYGCYQCPATYIVSFVPDRAVSVSDGPVCNQVRYRLATRHGAGTGLLGTDCPSGQFYDLANARCFSCPFGYERTVFAVGDERACEVRAGVRTTPPVYIDNPN